MIGPELVRETTEKIRVIRDMLLAAQSRQKSYADHMRRPLEFQVGDHVFLRVSPHKGVFHFSKKGNWPLGTLVHLRFSKELER